MGEVEKNTRRKEGGTVNVASSVGKMQNGEAFKGVRVRDGGPRGTSVTALPCEPEISVFPA